MAIAEEKVLNPNLVKGIQRDQAIEHAKFVAPIAALPEIKTEYMFFKSGDLHNLTGNIDKYPQFKDDLDRFFTEFAKEFFEYSSKMGMHFEGLEYHAMSCGPALYMELCRSKVNDMIYIIPCNQIGAYDFMIKKRATKRP